MAFELNTQQRQAQKLGKQWFLNGTEQVFEISGPAGSGKTTIVKEITDDIPLKREEVLFVAYIGKAAQNLALNGLNAKTIHSTIYLLVDEPIPDGKGGYLIKHGRYITRKRFMLKEQIDPSIKLIVLDEGGTVDESLAKDLLSFGLPVLVLGDLNQLPPPFGESPFLKNPDVILTEIMRQAENSPIIWMSQMILKGHEIPFGKYGDCYVVSYDELCDNMMKSVDMMICARNRTKDDLNAYYRQEIDKVPSDIPIIVGDKVVCRRNNWSRSVDDNIFLINGMVGYVEAVHLETLKNDTIEIDFRPDFLSDKVFRNVLIDLAFLQAPSNSDYRGSMYIDRFQYGRAISVYMSQGSQYDSILYYREFMRGKDFQKRQDYTAITRAKHGLIMVT